jgi:hypothetical protein
MGSVEIEISFRKAVRASSALAGEDDGLIITKAT